MAKMMGFGKLRAEMDKGIREPGVRGKKIGRARYGKSRFEQFAAALRKVKGGKEE